MLNLAKKKLKEISNLNDYILELLSNKAFSIFTDGSKVKNNQSMAFAYYCLELNISHQASMSKRASVFTAATIDQTLSLALEHREHSLLVSTDSLSALQIFKNINISTKVNEYNFSIKQKFYLHSDINNYDLKLEFY
jgi:hypothetical protein